MRRRAMRPLASEHGGTASEPRAWLFGLSALELVILVDMIMRMSPSEGGEQEQPGFWEWALPGWKRCAQSMRFRL